MHTQEPPPNTAPKTDGWRRALGFGRSAASSVGVPAEVREYEVLRITKKVGSLLLLNASGASAVDKDDLASRVGRIGSDSPIKEDY